ncbi:MAG: hypothetical protein H6Q70_3152 [Firmicutes bacterium]|nr:hypothetical protein [Bacillota bacterium]
MSGIKDLYGVLKGNVYKYNEGDARTDPHSPHVYIYVNANDIKYEIVVNTKSVSRTPIEIDGNEVPNDLLYIAERNFDAKLITNLQKLSDGFYPIKYHNKFVLDKSDYPRSIPVEFPSSQYNPKDIAIDFVRNRLFDPCKMTIMPSDEIGPDNDLADFFKNI